MRARAAGPEEMIPGGPNDARELRRRIDAPIGDRSNWEPDWPDTALEFVPLGKAKRLREGSDITVVTYGRMARVAMKAADEIRESRNVHTDLLDLRSLHPYDWDAIKESVAKTGRVVFVNEDTEITNFGEHLIRRTCEELFSQLKAPPMLHAGKHLPGVGLADALENASVPGLESTKEAMLELADTPEIGRGMTSVQPKVKRSTVSLSFNMDEALLGGDSEAAIGRSLRYR